MSVTIDIDIEDIWDEVSDRELVNELKSRLKRAESGQGHGSLMAMLKKREIECAHEIEGENSLSANNLIDEFKIKAFKEAMEKYSLEEIENRLK